MRQLKNNNSASISPVITFVVILFFCGFIAGIFGIIINAVVPASESVIPKTTMDDLMLKAFIVVPIIVFISASSWLLMTAQKTNFRQV